MKKYKLIQSRRAEMARDTGFWITMNHVHIACIAHTVYSWPHGRSLCTYVNTYAIGCGVLWGTCNNRTMVPHKEIQWNNGTPQGGGQLAAPPPL